MYKKFVNTVKLLNLIFQSLYTLALPIGCGALISHLTTKHLSWPDWVWALFLTLGVIIGLVSMVKYILTDIKNMERMKALAEANDALEREKAQKQQSLREEFKKAESEE